MPEIRPRSNTEILDVSFEILKRNFSPFFTLALITLIPSTVIEFMVGPKTPPPGATPEEVMAMGGLMGMSPSGLFLMILVGMLFGTIAYGSFILMTRDAYHDETVDMGKSVQAILPKFLGIFIAAVVLWILFMIGFVLLVIPGILFMVWYFAAITIMILENKGLFESMKRSRELAKGNFGRIFLVLIAMFALLLLTGIIGSTLGGVTGSKVIGAVISLAISATFLPLYSIAYTVLYFDIRLRKEGATIGSTPDALPGITPIASV